MLSYFLFFIFNVFKGPGDKFVLITIDITFEIVNTSHYRYLPVLDYLLIIYLFFTFLKSTNHYMKYEMHFVPLRSWFYIYGYNFIGSFNLI